MKKILLLLATTISINATGQQHVVTYYDAFNIHRREVYDLDKNAQMNGNYTAYFEDGTIAETGSYVHGALNGKYVKYVNQDGVRGISNIDCYKLGELDGLQQEFMYGMSLPLYKKPFTEKFYKDKHLVWEKEYDCPNKDESKRYLWKWKKYKDDEQIWERGYLPDGRVWYSGNWIHTPLRNTPDSGWVGGEIYFTDSLEGGKRVTPPSRD